MFEPLADVTDRVPIQVQRTQFRICQHRIVRPSSHPFRCGGGGGGGDGRSDAVCDTRLCFWNAG